MNLDFKNGCETEFKDYNEKSCNLSRKRISHKIDFKVVWPRNGHAASVGAKTYSLVMNHYTKVKVKIKFLLILT